MWTLRALGGLDRPVSQIHYLAYYQLHEIPWNLPDTQRFEARPSGIQFHVGRGPYTIPRLAAPTVKTKAGGAAVSTVNENFVLEGETYFSIAIPQSLWESGELSTSYDWDRSSQLADDAASAVGLCLNQRLKLSKVAEYMSEANPDGGYPKLQTRWQFPTGAKASVSKRSIGSVKRALSRVLDEEIAPQILVALRWYEQSKTAVVGSDRLVALWIALEGLMAPVGTYPAMVKKTANYLARREFRLNLTPDQIIAALGLDQMRRLRNDIVHEGARWMPWPISNDPNYRDWPQILDDIVGEILRHRLKATLARTLGKHVKDGLERG